MMRRLLTGLMIGFLGIPSTGVYAGTPVYDATSHARLVSQLNKMAKAYQKQLQQLEEAIKQSNALTGPRHMGRLANGKLEQALRTYLPDSWEDTLALINHSPKAIDTPLQGRLLDLYERFQPLTNKAYLPQEPDHSLAEAYARHKQSVYISLGASEEVFNSIQTRLQSYNELLEALNTTQDLKDSSDLQARIAAENGLLLTELLRLQTISMQMQGASKNHGLMQQKRAVNAHHYDSLEAKKALQLDGYGRNNP